MARRRQLVMLDARAVGRLAVPEDRGTVSFVEQAKDVEALREHLGLDRFDVLAHSVGCLTAQEYLGGVPRPDPPRGAGGSRRPGGPRAGRRPARRTTGGPLGRALGTATPPRLTG
ncbi:alpha/beta fold hydrolase [Actinacidiphila soli]|uniref:alpha/beta fold hydrolase n=1 Tax=Actinacidiphila soli TaxID=2487275 RepID=UPI001F0BDF7A|nr:alpha/beta fold hydrolase [Actinacidiphila soli]